MYKKLVEYDYIRNQPILSDKTPYRCRFCEEIKGPDEFKEIAHAVAECIGNKAIISSYECDKCNRCFSTYESELGKLYTLSQYSYQSVLNQLAATPRFSAFSLLVIAP